MPGPDHVNRLQLVIEKSVHRAREHRHAYRLGPEKQSAASLELRNRGPEEAPGRAEKLRTAHSAAFMRILASEDALLGMGRSLRDEPFAVASLTRSALEWCALARWLLDDISEDERLARGMTDYIYSLWQVGRLVQDADRKAYYTARITQEIEEARSFGLPVEQVRGRQKGLYYVEAVRPTTSALIETLLRPFAPGLGTFAWQLLSGIAHGTTGFMTEMFREETPPLPLAEHPGPFAQKGAEKRVLTMAATALIGFFEAFGGVVRVYRWDFPAWEKWAAEPQPWLTMLVAGAQDRGPVR